MNETTEAGLRLAVIAGETAQMVLREADEATCATPEEAAAVQSVADQLRGALALLVGNISGL